LHETVVQKAVREAARKVDIRKHATPHVFRGTVSPPIFYRTTTTFGRCRNCLATRM
jgi:hypothetical protein